MPTLSTDGLPDPTFTGGSLLNQSGFGGSLAKLQSMTPGWTETDGYDEEITNSDQRVTRVYEGPWTSRVAFSQWVLGYATSVQIGPLNALQRSLPLQDM